MMERMIFILVVSWFLTSCSTTYYIVRHAEKAQPSESANMVTTNDPPLSSAGEERANALREVLKDRHVGSIYSTNTKRSLSTGAPLSAFTGVNTELYTQIDDAFINKLKAARKNTLVVGHSNTIDDIVNRITGKNYIAADLPDAAYDNLYIIKKCGAKMKFKATTYGVPAH
jgi:broad specificity phosphatase PhoE